MAPPLAAPPMRHGWGLPMGRPVGGATGGAVGQGMRGVWVGMGTARGNGRRAHSATVMGMDGS